MSKNYIIMKIISKKCKTLLKWNKSRKMQIFPKKVLLLEMYIQYIQNVFVAWKARIKKKKIENVPNEI